MNGPETKKIRIAMGETQTEFAMRIGVSRRSLQYWENDERPISEPVKKLLEFYRDDQKRKESDNG
jgi:DNA-binding transcriptional regulator YiaG